MAATNNVSVCRRRAVRRLSTWRTLRSLRAVFLLLLTAPLTVGGQAVIEGVMMRSPGSFAIAVRRRDGSIVLREQRINRFLSQFKPLRWPLIRGAVMLIESLLNGLSALNFAADQAMLDEQSSDNSKPEPSTTKPGQSQDLTKDASAGEKAALWGTLLISLLLGLVLFVGLPHGLTFLLGMLVPGGLSLDHAWFHLVDGSFKLAIFIAYIVLISRFDDVKRLFMFHGAEHMSVHTYENQLSLDVEHARPMSTAHPRCGTSLILWVVAVSIFMFAAVFPMLPQFFVNPWAKHALAIVIKIFLSLPVAGVAYEIQRAAAKHPNVGWVQALILPGMWMQSLTTRKPGDAELEIGLAALRRVLWRENQPPLSEVQDQETQRHANFAALCETLSPRLS